MTLQILDRLAAHAASHPSRIAAREVGPACAAAITYADLSARVHRGSCELARRLAPGEVALLITGNRIEFSIAALAAWSAGAALMPIHTSVADAELAAIIDRTGAKVLMSDARCVRRYTAHIPQINLGAFGLREAPAAARPHGAAALLLQSSGTTGLPKIVRRPAPAIDAVARNVAQATKLTGDDRVFAAIPICHAYGIENGFLAAIWAGATVHLCDGLDVPTAVQQFWTPATPGLSDSDREAPGRTVPTATIFPGVPFMFEVLSKLTIVPHSAPTLRLAYSAGAMLPPWVSRAFTATFGAPIGQLYGASELGSVTFGDPGAPDADPASAGVPMPGVRILILDTDKPDTLSPLPTGEEGHVAIHAPSMMARYVEGDAPIKDGYFLTGDLGRVSADGRLYITGRLKNLIDVGGMKVNPAEVELTLKQHPAVAECVVVAVPVTETVSRLKAIVTPSGNAAPDEAELKAFARDRLAGFKVPRTVEVRESLPRSPTGKILRRELEAARPCEDAGTP